MVVWLLDYWNISANLVKHYFLTTLVKLNNLCFDDYPRHVNSLGNIKQGWVPGGVGGGMVGWFWPNILSIEKVNNMCISILQIHVFSSDVYSQFEVTGIYCRIFISDISTPNQNGYYSRICGFQTLSIPVLFHKWKRKRKIYWLL